MARAIYPHDVKTLRERLGETQAGLARLLGVSESTVTKWEAGAARPVGERARAIERLLGEAPPPPRDAATVPALVGTYDHAIGTWEAERNERVRAGEPTGLADQVLRVLRNTRESLLKTATDD
jgi:transcriptional regulator with XRE-family HTH domain